MLCALWSLREFELNQTAYVREARGSLGTKNMAANQDVEMSFGYGKSGYFQRWLEYSSAFEVLNARGKLKLVSPISRPDGKLED